MNEQIDFEKLRNAIHDLYKLTVNVQDINKQISSVIKDLYDAIDGKKEETK